MEKITKLLQGTAGIGSIELLQVMPLSGDETQELIKLIIQIAVGIVTIWTMLRNKKQK
jgi:hypothetical protein